MVKKVKRATLGGAARQGGKQAQTLQEVFNSTQQRIVNVERQVQHLAQKAVQRDVWVKIGLKTINLSDAQEIDVDGSKVVVSGVEWVQEIDCRDFESLKQYEEVMGDKTYPDAALVVNGIIRSALLESGAIFLDLDQQVLNIVPKGAEPVENLDEVEDEDLPDFLSDDGDDWTEEEDEVPEEVQAENV